MGAWDLVESSCLSALQNMVLGLGGGVLEGASAAVVGGPFGGGREIRHSRRLAAKEATPIVDKAIARRALREDVGCNE